MDGAKSIFIYEKGDQRSAQTAALLRQKLRDAGIAVRDSFGEDVDMIICVGGDGTFLHMLMDCAYPPVPVAGVNTGHLGFFQEFMPDDLDELVRVCLTGDCSIQKHRLLSARIKMGGGEEIEYFALNDFVIRRSNGSVIHLNLNIGSSFIERFSGDGMLVSTAAGSTAYNYSLGGSIVDPRVNMIQVTPMAPMNSKAFRSFTSSVILPPDMAVSIYPDPDYRNNVLIMVDGVEHLFDNVEDVIVSYSPVEVSLVRLAGYDFWGKVMSKFL
ncbi:MAG TPA: NAD(+)/NADH kinase [Bacillota bacterium]|nr:NAD(+)/NADH kinase [Bacillota bacterium]